MPVLSTQRPTPRLPLEVLSEIIKWTVYYDYYGFETRRALTKVNRAFAKETWKHRLAPDGEFHTNFGSASYVRRLLKCCKSKPYITNTVRMASITAHRRDPQRIWETTPLVLKRFPRLRHLEISIEAWQRLDYRHSNNSIPFIPDTDPKVYRSQLATLKITNVYPVAFLGCVLDGIENSEERKFTSLTIAGSLLASGGPNFVTSLEDAKAIFTNRSRVFTNLVSLELDFGCDWILEALSKVPIDVFPSLKKLSIVPELAMGLLNGLRAIELFAGQLTDVRIRSSIPISMTNEDNLHEQQQIDAVWKGNKAILSTLSNLQTLELSLLIPDGCEERSAYTTIETFNQLVLAAGATHTIEVLNFNFRFMRPVFFWEGRCPHNNQGELLNYLIPLECKDKHPDLPTPIIDLFQEHLTNRTLFPVLRKVNVMIHLPERRSFDTWELDEWEPYLVDREARMQKLLDEWYQSEECDEIIRSQNPGAADHQDIVKQPRLWCDFNGELISSFKHFVAGRLVDEVDVSVDVKWYDLPGGERLF